MFFLLQTLKGAIIFASDLVRAIHPVPDGLEMGFVRASSYGAGTKTSGKVVLGISTLKDEDIQGRHVLLVSYFEYTVCTHTLNGNTKACDDGLFMLSPAASVANKERRRAGTFNRVPVGYVRMTTDPLPTDACCFSTASVHFLKGHNS